MRNVRRDLHRELLQTNTEQQLMDCSYGSYLPFAFDAMLQHLHKLSKRQQILRSISDPKEVAVREVAKKDALNFVKLFKEYQGRVDDSGTTHPTFLRLRMNKKLDNPFSAVTSPHNGGSALLSNQRISLKRSSLVIPNFRSISISPIFIYF